MDEIKAAYRGLAKELHPDRNPSPGARAEFQRVRSAYVLLGDPRRRREHDHPTPPAPAATAVGGRRASRRRLYILSGLGLAGAALALFLLPTGSPAPARQSFDFDGTMEAAILREAREFTGMPAASPNVQVPGRDGRVLSLSREDYRRLEPKQTRLLAEEQSLRERAGRLLARKSQLEAEQEATARSDVAAAEALRVRVEAFNRAGASFQRELAAHRRASDALHLEMERAAGVGR